MPLEKAANGSDGLANGDGRDGSEMNNGPQGRGAGDPERQQAGEVQHTALFDF